MHDSDRPPSEARCRLRASGSGHFPVSKHYRALQYLTFTRPNIAYVIQQICLHMHDPWEPHLMTMKLILRYLQGTMAYGLLLRRSSSFDLMAYTDIDWVGCSDTHCSSPFFFWT
jgi:hypothetical protein